MPHDITPYQEYAIKQFLSSVSISQMKKLNNGLPHPAPLLFNLYIHDLPPPISRKFIYADDIALVTQHQTVETTKQILNTDLRTLNANFKKYRLCPGTSITDISCFHLNSQLERSHLTVTLNNVVISNNKVYCCYSEFIAKT